MNKYIHPFGASWRERNLFQEYYFPMVECIENDDKIGFDQLKNELLEMEMGQEKYVYVWRHIASYTRSKTKEW